MYRADELPVTLAGCYTLTALIGSGGMAAVYRAEVDLEGFDFALVISHSEIQRGETRELRQERRAERYKKWSRKSREELEQICRDNALPYPSDGVAAVKVLMPNVKAQDRFEAEWISMLAVGHPNLVEVFGGGVDPVSDVHYYSMELLPRILTRKEMRTLSLRHKLSIIRQAACGLDCLHDKGIIHRDIKPDNIVCVRDGEDIKAKICDLGIAKDTNRTIELTVTEQVMGTPYYMAPEQAEGARHVTAASDVYSLGATLYKIVSGTAPYQGQSLFEVMGKLARGEPPTPIRELTEGKVPEMLEVVIERMMAFRPASRPRQMGRVIQAIDRYLELTDADLEGARTIMDLPAAQKVQTIQRREFEALLGPAVPGDAAPGGFSRGRVLGLCMIILLGFSVGFLLGPGRKYLKPYLGGQTDPDGSQLAGGDGDNKPPDGDNKPPDGDNKPPDGDNKPPDGDNKPPEPSPEQIRKQKFEGRLASVIREARRLSQQEEFDKALEGLDGMIADAARFEMTSRLSAARQEVEESRSRKRKEVEAQIVAAGERPYADALSRLEELRAAAVRHRLTGELDAVLKGVRRAHEKVLAATRNKRRAALLAQLQTIPGLIDKERFSEALALLKKLEAPAGTYGLEAERKARLAQVRKAEAARRLASIAGLIKKDEYPAALKLLKDLEGRASEEVLNKRRAEVLAKRNSRVESLVGDLKLVEQLPRDGTFRGLVDELRKVHPAYEGLADWERKLKPPKRR